MALWFSCDLIYRYICNKSPNAIELNFISSKMIPLKYIENKIQTKLNKLKMFDFLIQFVKNPLKFHADRVAYCILYGKLINLYGKHLHFSTIRPKTRQKNAYLMANV